MFPRPIEPFRETPLNFLCGLCVNEKLIRDHVYFLIGIKEDFLKEFDEMNPYTGCWFLKCVNCDDEFHVCSEQDVNSG